MTQPNRDVKFKYLPLKSDDPMEAKRPATCPGLTQVYFFAPTLMETLKEGSDWLQLNPGMEEHIEGADVVQPLKNADWYLTLYIG